MKIKTLPRAHSDETFTSWIYRCAVNRKCIQVTLHDVEEYVDQWRVGTEVIDVDFDLDTALFTKLCNSIGLDLSCTIPFFLLPSDTLSLSYWFRYAYCAECINSDVIVYGFPYWRKEWCYVDCPCCLLHGKLLSILNDDSHTDVHKPWRAFANNKVSLIDSSYRGSANKYRQPILPLRDNYACRVQHFLCSARRSKSVYVPRSGCHVSAENVLQCSNILLSTFLSVRTERWLGGIARQLVTDIPDKIYHRPYSKKSRMLLGVEEAIPYIRLVAILLVGWVFGIISDNELSRIKGYAEREYYWMPDSIKELGYLAASFGNEKEFIWYVNLFRPLSLDLKKGLVPFFIGVNVRYEKDMESVLGYQKCAFGVESRDEQILRWLD